MFDPMEAKSDPNFYEDLRNDVEQECSKIGPVVSVKIMERNPEGVVAVKFSNAIAASKCIEVMNGRYFGGNKLSADFYDGYSNYFVQETEEDRKEREASWQKWLMGNDDYEDLNKNNKGDDEN